MIITSVTGTIIAIFFGRDYVIKSIINFNNEEIHGNNNVIDSRTYNYYSTPTYKNVEISKLSVTDIMNMVEKAVPFQRKNIENSFIGLTVTWSGYFYNIDTFTNPPRAIISTRNDFPRPAFIFYVPLDKYPEFKSLQLWHKITVTGKIKEVSLDGLCVDLNPTEINF